MNCPVCRNPISVRSDRCPHCHHTLDPDTAARLHAALDIRDQLAYLETLSGYIARSITTIEHRLAELEAPPRPSQTLQPTATPADAPVSSEAGVASFDARSADDVTVTYFPSQPAVGDHEAAPAAQPGPPTDGRLSGEIRFGQKWLLVIGIISTVFAVAYFLKFSFTQGWIGPAGRVTLSFLAGLAFLGTGEFCYRRNWARFGLYLAGGGIAVLYFAAFAAFQLYHLFPHWLAFLIMVGITGSAGTFAMARDAKGLAVLGIIGGFGTPVLLSTGVPNPVALMTYMLILNGAILWLSSRREWPLLASLGFVCTWMLFAAWYGQYYAPDHFAVTMTFMLLFFLIYAVTPAAPALFHDAAVPVGRLWYMGPNALLAFGYSVAMIEPRFGIAYVSIITLSFAAIFLFMASLLQHDPARHESGFWYLIGNAVFFLLVTIPILFDGEWVTVSWALEAAVFLWFAGKLVRPWMRVGAWALLFFVVAKLVVYDYPFVFLLDMSPIHFQQGFGHHMLSRWVTGGTVLGVLWWARRRLRTGPQSMQGGRACCTVIFGGLLFLLLSWETAAYCNDHLPAATFAAVSVLWTMFAAVLMVQGFRVPSTALRRSAIGLFLVTLAKVFLFDIARFSTPFRILSFLVLGLLLIASSWLYYRFREHLLPSNRSNDAS